MKLITAIIKPFKLDEVRQVVSDLGVNGPGLTAQQLTAQAMPVGEPSESSG